MKDYACYLRHITLLASCFLCVFACVNLCLIVAQLLCETTVPPAEQTHSIILSTVTLYCVCVYPGMYFVCVCVYACVFSPCILFHLSLFLLLMPYRILKPERVIKDKVLLYALEKNLCALMLREETEVWRLHGL